MKKRKPLRPPLRSLLPHRLEPGDGDELYVKRGFWPKLKRVARRFPIVEDAVALYYTAFDENTPKWARRIALTALAYFVLPIDVIPDAIVLTGLTDDAGIVAMALKALSKYVKPEHHEKAKAWLKK